MELFYSYPKEVSFGGRRRIVQLQLETPEYHAANAALRAHRQSQPEPGAEEVSSVNGWFTLRVRVQSSRSEDVPSIALVHNGQTRTPSRIAHPLSEGPCSMGSFTWLQCKFYALRLEFSFRRSDRLAGIGHFVIHWNGTEKRVPINFDWLW